MSSKKSSPKRSQAYKNVQKKIGQSLLDKREIIDDCRSRQYSNDINDIRQQYVPPHEVKNELNQIKQQLRELKRFQKQLAKTAGAALAEKMIAELEQAQKTISESFGQDQRDALEDYRQARYWDEMNKVRAYAEIPRNLSGASKDLKALDRFVGQKNLGKALSFFGVDLSLVKNALAAKRVTIDQINAALSSGDADEAQALMEESIYQGWHPGDLRHALDMFRESYDTLRFLKGDSEIREEVLAVLEPIVEAFNAGEYRESRDALVQFTNELRPYRQYFERSGKSGLNLDAKTRKLLNKLEATIEQKLGSEESSDMRLQAK